MTVSVCESNELQPRVLLSLRTQAWIATGLMGVRSGKIARAFVPRGTCRAYGMPRYICASQFPLTPHSGDTPYRGEAAPLLVELLCFLLFLFFLIF